MEGINLAISLGWCRRRAAVRAAALAVADVDKKKP